MIVTRYRLAAALAVGLLVLTAVSISPLMQPFHVRSEAVANQTLNETVDKAFTALRSGDFAPAAALGKAGPAMIPAVAAYLRDGNEDVRRQAVTLLGQSGDATAGPHLAIALADPSDDIVRRASEALYKIGGDAVSDPSVGAALREAVEAGRDSAGAILLLGYVAGDKTVATLNALRSKDADRSTEVFHWSPVMPVAFVADVALARLGDADAKGRLMAAVRGGDLDSLMFLLSALRDIEDSDILGTLAEATLSDRRPVEGDVPSHADVDTRLADVAAARFSERYGLTAGGGPKADRARSDDELDAVRKAVAERLGR
ncbi:MAG: HEAT repeat domain-containing protein [Pseudomonadota bacterium]